MQRETNRKCRSSFWLISRIVNKVIGIVIECICIRFLFKSTGSLALVRESKEISDQVKLSCAVVR